MHHQSDPIITAHLISNPTCFAALHDLDAAVESHHHHRRSGDGEEKPPPEGWQANAYNRSPLLACHDGEQVVRAGRLWARGAVLRVGFVRGTAWQKVRAGRHPKLFFFFSSLFLVGRLTWMPCV